MAELIDFNWQVDVVISDESKLNVCEPVCKLAFVTKTEEEKIEKQLYELDLSQVDELLNNLKQIRDEFKEFEDS
eukprot:TRINITY_DN4175_c0_g1_i1.p1 TRINITY_DN4175_c0_g1~~TRINITY_DN4175_c0_g1_i1.p1  ORF type:complete len:74 (+),score=27.57 TRINITY_DN4175_c0_g1_i1:25-246(+)